MISLCKNLLTVAFFIFLLTGSLWAVRPIQGKSVASDQVKDEKQTVIRRGFDYSEEPAPPGVIEAIETERKLKREVIQRKRKKESQLGKKLEKSIVEKIPIEKDIVEKLPGQQSVVLPKPHTAGHFRLFIILVISLMLILLALAYYIYWHKK